MSSEFEVIHSRIYQAWCQYTRQTLNFNMNLGFKKGDSTDPDYSCTIVLHFYPNIFSGTMTHLQGRPLDPPVTGDWYVLREPAIVSNDVRNDTEAPQYLHSFGDTPEAAMLGAEKKLHALFTPATPKDSP